MKLWNVTSAVALGALFAFGCSVENGTPSTDGGTDTGAVGGDTGVKTDTGPAGDTGTVTDTGMTAETGMKCAVCQATQCKAEEDACKASAATLKGCNDLGACLSKCTDDACANKCVTDSMSAEGKALLTCFIAKCKDCTP